jgi:hypothetical protein
MPVECRGYRIGEFCLAFRVSKETAYTLMRSGKLRYVVIGGRRLILRESAEELLRTGDGSRVRDGWQRAVRAGFSSDVAYCEHLRQKQKRRSASRTEHAGAEA